MDQGSGGVGGETNPLCETNGFSTTAVINYSTTEMLYGMRLASLEVYKR